MILFCEFAKIFLAKEHAKKRVIAKTEAITKIFFFIQKQSYLFYIKCSHVY